ncbi:MAG: hypothetical protein BWX90_00935 [bacterium ADurb.Bin132]|nr:MAG: hypothetical protein BWX90_00935 [bacterium ADurb.Bin132]
MVKAHYFDRAYCLYLLYFLVCVIKQGLDPSPRISGLDIISGLELSALDNGSCQWPYKSVHVRFDDGSSKLACFVHLQVEYVGLKKYHFKEILNAITRFCGDWGDHSVTTPCFWRQAKLCKLGVKFVEVGTWTVHLVCSHNDCYLGLFCHVECFNCLFFDTFICSYDKNNYISDVGAFPPHCCKGFVTRSVNEDDVPVIYYYLVGADALCYSTGFSKCNRGFSYVIKEGCFAMVNMTHDCDDW